MMSVDLLSGLEKWTYKLRAHNYEQYTSFPIHLHRFIQGGPKNGLFLRVDNFAMVNRRKACDMSIVSEFCLENV